MLRFVKRIVKEKEVVPTWYLGGMAKSSLTVEKEVRILQFMDGEGYWTDVPIVEEFKSWPEKDTVTKPR